MLARHHGIRVDFTTEWRQEISHGEYILFSRGTNECYIIIIDLDSYYLASLFVFGNQLSFYFVRHIFRILTQLTRCLYYAVSILILYE